MGDLDNVSFSTYVLLPNDSVNLLPDSGKEIEAPESVDRPYTAFRILAALALK